MNERASTGAPRTAPPPPPPPRPPLRRDREAGILGGVAAGLASHLDVDVVLVRVAFVVGSILTQGLGLLAYVLCWVFIPQAEPGTATHPRREVASDSRGATFWVGIGLLTMGALWFLGGMSWPRVFGVGWIDGGVLVPLLLIGLGVALWRTSSQPPAASNATATSTSTPDRRPPAPAAPGGTQAPSLETPMSTITPAPTTDPSQGSDPGSGSSSSDPGLGEDTVRVDDPVRPSLSDVDPGSDEGAAAPPPPPPAAPASQGDGFTPPPVPERKPRSLLTRLTLGAALVTVGVLWILEVTTTLALGPLRILAIGLAVIGLGLLVGSVLGRGRALIIVGVLLLPLVLVGTLLRGVPGFDSLESSFRGSPWVGERSEQPITVEDLESSYSLGAGSFELDLRDLVLEEDASTLIEIGAGEVVVIVASDINVEVSSSLAGGEIRLFDQRRAGLGVDHRVFDPAQIDDPESAPTLSLRVNGGFGDLEVRR